MPIETRGRTAVFLDRDGVLIEDIGDSPKQEISVLPKVIEGLKLFKGHGLALIVITNQPAIAKGLLTEEQIKMTHQKLNDELGGVIDAFYYCPHHPTKGTIPEFTKDCECRKPKTGLLIQATKDFGLDLKSCFMVGDFTWDIKTGENAGCVTILVDYPKRPPEEIEKIVMEANPNFHCHDFLEVAEKIVSRL